MNKQSRVYAYDDTDTCCNMDEPQRQHVKWKKQDTKDNGLHYSFHIKCLKKANVQRQKVNGGYLGLRMEVGSDYKWTLGSFSAQWKCYKIKL